MTRLARLPTFERGAEGEPGRAGHAPRLRTRYYAFLSYSHNDKELADWLHRELEKFRVPNSLAGKLTANGVVPRRLTPIFRDQHDLSAGADLAVEIEAALAASQFLVVLCSPTAAKSHWTNLEIESFKRTRPEGCVLAAVASGEPFASDIRGREDEECFPPALRYKYDRRGHRTNKRADPLAADFRDGGDTNRTAFLKLVAGMLGVGLDELVQRETVRRQRRLAYVAAASLAGMAITSTLAVTAIQARDSAREQRREAEGLVAFMLGDLKDKLEPIGRLDALDGVGARVLAYYQNEGTADLSDAALSQRSEALSLMAQVANLRGDTKTAMRLYREAMAGTAEAIRRDPQNAERLYEHAQNVFWVGELDRELGDLPTAEAAMRNYKALAQRMIALDPNNMKWRMEEQDSDANLGIVLYERRQFRDAAILLRQAVQMTEAFATADPHNGEYQQDLTEIYAWLADSEMANGDLDQATSIREQHVALLNRLIAQPRSDVIYRQKLIPAEEGLGTLYIQRGQTELGLQHLRTAVSVADQLIPVEPNNTMWIDLGLWARIQLAEKLLENHQLGPASEQADIACATASRLLARNSQLPWWRAGARSCWAIRSKIALAMAKNDEADQDAKRAVDFGLTVKSSDPVDDRFGLSEAYLVLGDAQRALGNSPSALAAWRNALSSLPTGVAEKPSETLRRAVILLRLGRRSEAEPLLERLRLMGYHSSEL